MKLTRRKNVLRGIRSTLNRFLSILFIVALGSGFLAGLSAATPDMREAADRYMDESRWYDVDIKCALGFEEADAEALGNIEGVAGVMKARVVDVVLESDDRTEYTARVFGYADGGGLGEMNLLTVASGRLPAAAGECALELPSGDYGADAPEIGGKLTLAPENAEAIAGAFATSELTVVGIVESPMFISVEPEKTNVGAGSIGLGVYVTESSFALPVYTDLYVTCEGALAENTFSDEYWALIAGAAEKIEALGEERAKLNGERLEAAASALRGVASDERALAGDALVRAGQCRLAAEALREAGAGGSAALAEALEGLAADVEEAVIALGEGDVAPELDVGGVKWLLFTREDNRGYASYESNTAKVAALCKVFPAFFFMVALLVALTTMTRLVEENRPQIGALKAMGYSDWQVLSEYLLYSLLASVLGCALGCAVGFRAFPAVISTAYGMMYRLPAIATPFRPEIAFAVCPAAIGAILLATWLACAAETRARPAELMRPKAPAPGKRVFLERLPFIWKRLSFTRKVTARNILRYKKRLYMTVIGVAGCGALLVAGFGLRDSINDIVDKQFGEIYKYDMSLKLTSADAASEDAGLAALLADGAAVSDYLAYASESGRVTFGGGSARVSVSVPRSGARLPDFIALRERASGKTIAFGGEGVVLTEKLCEGLGIRAGDVVTLENEEGEHALVAVAGVTENYLTSFAYMTPEAYRLAFGDEPDYGMLLVKAAEGADAGEVASRALASAGVAYALSSAEIEDAFADSVKSIDYVVVVLIIAAGALSMVVLFNLTNVNVCERRKELATIRVLGFYEREVQRYIFREVDILSGAGTVVGLAVGVWLHNFVVKTIEIDGVMFGREIAPLSFAWAFAISILFTGLVNLIMRRRISAIDMVESMKAND